MELTESSAPVDPCPEAPAACLFAGLQYLRELDADQNGWLPLAAFAHAQVPDCFEVVRRPEGCYVRAAGYVGLTSVRCERCDVDHVVAIYPKGAPAGADDAGAWAALNRFLDLVLVAQGYDPGERPAVELDASRGWQRFFVLFALGFTRALDELCRRDFRLYYRREDAERATVRGRVDLVRHSLNVVRGRGTRIPCRWEEFTADHLDNRLLAMARAAAAGVLRDLPASMRRQWRSRHAATAPHFSEVDAAAVTRADFARSQLRRLSPFYREALLWAEWLTRGVRAAQLRGRRPAPALLFDTAKLFEAFVRRIVRDTATALGRTCSSPAHGALLERPIKGCAPDAVIEPDSDAPAVIIDAKYKRGVADDADDRVQLGNDGFTTAIATADLYQVYYYLRLWTAPLGVIAMPFWDEHRPAAILVPGARYAKSPLDGGSPAEVMILGLNLQRPPRQVLAEGKRRLAKCITERAAARSSPNDHRSVAG